MPKIAILQMCSGIDPEANFAALEDAARRAAAEGAAILFTPEMSLLLDRKRKRSAPWIESEAPAQMIGRLQAVSADAGIDIALGSIPIASGSNSSAELWANRSVYAAPGKAAVTYDKIHMFDVELASGEHWRESAAYRPGEQVVTVEDTAIGRLGLSICYDLRFPALFEALGQQCCDAIAVPAAFTKPTGEAHWHVLLRARAIEASAFVIAAAQVGRHADGRETYGHSLVVDPWGDILLDMGGAEPGLAFCDIDMERIDEVRGQLPSLANRRVIPN